MSPDSELLIYLERADGEVESQVIPLASVVKWHVALRPVRP